MDNKPLERKKVEKVVKGNVTVKKKNEISKFADVFISEDIKNVKSYIFMDVLVPAMKKAIQDIVTEGIDMILYGERGNTSRISSVSYSNYYKKPATRDRFASSSNNVVSRTNAYNYETIVISNRGEAEEVLTRMDEILSEYGMVSVADLHDLLGVTGEYTDNRYGWTNIRNAEVVRVRGGGYQLKLPKALPIS